MVQELFQDFSVQGWNHAVELCFPNSTKHLDPLGAVLRQSVFPPLHIFHSIDEMEPKIYIFSKVFGDTKAVGPEATFEELLL